MVSVHKVRLVFKSYQSIIPVPEFKLSNYWRPSLMKTLGISQMRLGMLSCPPAHLAQAREVVTHHQKFPGFYNSFNCTAV